MIDKVRVLHIEDSPIVAGLVREMFASQESISFEIELFLDIKSAMERLARGGIDIILTDLKLPDSDGLNTFNRIYAEAPDVPIVIITGTYEEDGYALEAMKKGAQDYLRKTEVNPDSLVRAVRYSIERQATKNELKRVNAELNVLYSELKGAYADLKATQEKLVQSEKLAGLVRFSEGIAHEIRNPLSIIIGNSELLEKKLTDIDQAAKTSIGTIKTAAVRASDILKTFLVYTGSKNVAAEKTDACNMVQGIVAAFKDKNIPSNVKVVTEIAKEKICAKIEKGRMGEAVTNILNNAVEAMPKGGTITVKVYQSSESTYLPGVNACVIEIDDTGAGISKENMAKVFEPFFTTKDRKREGAGRGLFIAKSIVESFDGQLTIASIEEKGTSAKIILPCC